MDLAPTCRLAAAVEDRRTRDLHVRLRIPRRSGVTLEDVHMRHDHHRLRVDEVGISGIRYPVVVWDPNQGKQETVAEVAMAVDLDADTKGAHLSRFVEVLHEHAAAGELSPHSVAELAATVGARMH